MSTLIGILHPGKMGASVGAAAVAAGRGVMWSSEGRSEATRRRATAAGLDDVGSVDALVERSEVLLSICPPSAAVSVAGEAAARGFSGTYVDANAVSPRTASEVAAVVGAAGASYVDGGIIGPPAHREGTTRLYLSGVDAPRIAALFDGGPLDAIAIDGDDTAASALKVCYAAWTKGSAALLVAIRTLAHAEGVEEPLLHEWSLSQPGLEQRSGDAVRKNASKAWRFAGEMREIAASFSAAGMPSGFHAAAAEVYEGLAGFKDCEVPPSVSEAIGTLLGDGGKNEP